MDKYMSHIPKISIASHITILKFGMYRDGGTVGFLVSSDGPRNEICVGVKKQITWGHPKSRSTTESAVELSTHELLLFRNALIEFDKRHLSIINRVFEILSPKFCQNCGTVRLKSYIALDDENQFCYNCGTAYTNP